MAKTAWPEGQYCVIRTYSAGVHVGVVAQRAGAEVVLRDARRLWQWRGRNTLHEVSLAGVGVGSRVSEPVDGVLLTGVVEIIPCTQAGEASLRAAGWA